MRAQVSLVLSLVSDVSLQLQAMPRTPRSRFDRHRTVYHKPRKSQTPSASEAATRSTNNSSSSGTSSISPPPNRQPGGSSRTFPTRLPGLRIRIGHGEEEGQRATVQTLGAKILWGPERMDEKKTLEHLSLLRNIFIDMGCFNQQAFTELAAVIHADRVALHSPYPAIRSQLTIPATLHVRLENMRLDSWTPENTLRFQRLETLMTCIRWERTRAHQGNKEPQHPLNIFILMGREEVTHKTLTEDNQYEYRGLLDHIFQRLATAADAKNLMWLGSGNSHPLTRAGNLMKDLAQASEWRDPRVNSFDLETFLTRLHYHRGEWMPRVQESMMVTVMQYMQEGNLRMIPTSNMERRAAETLPRPPIIPPDNNRLDYEADSEEEDEPDTPQGRHRKQLKQDNEDYQALLRAMEEISQGQLREAEAVEDNVNQENGSEAEAAPQNPE